MTALTRYRRQPSGAQIWEPPLRPNSSGATSGEPAARLRGRALSHPVERQIQRSPLKSDAPATDQEQCAGIRSLRRESTYGGGMSVMSSLITSDVIVIRAAATIGQAATPRS